MTVEETVVMPAQLPDGQDWAWHPDLNIVEVSDRLDEAGVMVAVLDLQAQWRRRMIRLVPNQRPRHRPSNNTAPPSYALMRNDVVTTHPSLPRIEAP